MKNRPTTSAQKAKGSRTLKNPASIVLPKDEAELDAYVDALDLTEYNLSNLQDTRFEILRKEQQINLRMPKLLMDAVKMRAKARGIPYSRYIRDIIERDVAK